MKTQTILAIGAVLVIALGLALWWGWTQRERAIEAENRAAGLEASIEQIEGALTYATSQRDHWQSVATELSTVEGRDEDLNPYERAVLDRVRKP